MPSHRVAHTDFGSVSQNAAYRLLASGCVAISSQLSHTIIEDGLSADLGSSLENCTVKSCAKSQPRGGLRALMCLVERRRRLRSFDRGETSGEGR
jgi:hypothetical protein